MEQIIEMKKVNDVYEAVDMNPYSEYIYQNEKKEDKFQVVEPQLPQKLTQEQAMKNFNDFMSGIDTMMNVAEEVLKRFNRINRL